MDPVTSTIGAILAAVVGGAISELRHWRIARAREKRLLEQKDDARRDRTHEVFSDWDLRTQENRLRLLETQPSLLNSHGRVELSDGEPTKDDATKVFHGARVLNFIERAALLASRGAIDEEELVNRLGRPFVRWFDRLEPLRTWTKERNGVDSWEWLAGEVETWRERINPVSA